MTCDSCNHENRSGARFCASCGVRLPDRCRSCNQDLPPAARFCDACGTPVTLPMLTPARKVVTAVFGDLVGSTALHETLDPESVRGVMARFYEVMRAAVSRCDGHLEKFLGDGVVVVFGIPSVAEDDALRAVRCAATMVADLAGLGDELHRVWGVRLQMRIGVDTGELVISGGGELVGDAMNTAARLQQSAAPGEVLIGEATWRIVRHGVQLEPVAPLVLKGKTAPTRAWRLVSLEPDPDGSGSGPEVPLIGRTLELERLHAALGDAVRSRSCRLVTVIGSPGVGKTRLAAEFAVRVRGGTSGEAARPATVVRGRCEHIGEGITFLPVAEMLRGAGGITETDPPEVVRGKLTALVGEVADAGTVVARAASLLGAAEAVPAEETFWGVRRVLEGMARRAPLVVVFDDLHWGQPLFLDLIEHLVEWVRDAPMLVVALSRPELRDIREALTVRGRRAGDSPGRRACDVIELTPLDVDQSRELVRTLVGPAELPPELLELILETAGGNPLFLGETLRMLVDDGLLTDRRGVPPTGGWAMQVPPTISALLSARVERLRVEERAVIERAAVIGKQFHREAVAALLPPEFRADLDTHLDALRRKEMLEPDGTSWAGSDGGRWDDEPVYRFANVLIRDAAYRAMLKQSRAELHERYADWLAAKAGDIGGEYEDVIAYHLEQAHGYLGELGPLDEHGRALGVVVVSLLHAAGRRALARGDVAAAVSMLRRALNRTDRDHPELLWDLADVLLLTGDTARAGEIVRRHAALAADDPVLHARTEVLTGHLWLLTGGGAAEPAGGPGRAGGHPLGHAPDRVLEAATGDPDATVKRLTAAAAELAAAGDRAAAAEAHLVAARGHRQQGRFGAAVAALDRALVEARRAGDRRRVTEALAAAPRATLWGPTPVVRASGRCLDVLRVMRMTPGNRHVEPIALRCQAVLEGMRGRFDSARRILAAARATMQDLGQQVELCELAAHAGMIELLAGDAAAAQPHLTEARAGFGTLGIGVSAARASALLARALVENGADDDALAATRYAEDHAGGDLKATVTWTGVRAEILARRGEAEEALRLARYAVSVSESTDALPDKADSWLVLARVFALTGLGAKVDPAAKAARALYEAKGHTVGAAWTTELTGSPAPTRQRLATALASLGDEAPGRFVARMVRRWATGSVDAVLELYADNWRLVDHSHFGWGELHGLDQAQEALGGLLRSGPDPYLTVTEKLAGDDRVLAFTGILPGAAPNDGLAMGFIIVVEDGQLVEQHTYEPDAREQMLADYARLGGRPGVLGDRPPERAVAAFCRPWAPEELDELLDLFPADVVLVDHREESRPQGRAELRAKYRELLTRLRSLHVEPDEVLACDDRVIALRATIRGVGREPGDDMVTAIEYVFVVEGARIRRIEQYEPHDTAAVLARYAELGGSHEGLGDRPPERLFAELLRRSAGGGSLRDLFGEDFLMVDHRRLGWEDVTGAASAVELLASVFAMAPDMQVVVDEVLACDDRVMAVATTARGTAAEGGGALMMPVGWLVTVRDGRVERAEIFEPEDRAPMVARYAALGGGLGPLGDRPPERVWAESARRYAARDLDGLAELISADWSLVDHRSLGWESVRGHAEALNYLRSGFETTTDSYVDVAEVLACDDRVIALRLTVHGTSVDGVRFEQPLAVVSVVEDGRMVTREQYDHSDVEAMLERWRELTAG